MKDFEKCHDISKIVYGKTITTEGVILIENIFRLNPKKTPSPTLLESCFGYIFNLFPGKQPFDVKEIIEIGRVLSDLGIGFNFIDYLGKFFKSNHPTKNFLKSRNLGNTFYPSPLTIKIIPCIVCGQKGYCEHRHNKFLCKICREVVFTDNFRCPMCLVNFDLHKKTKNCQRLYTSYSSIKKNLGTYPDNQL